ncbi:galactokinase [Rheinheimera texasensis]|uniref:galactokinase n=1 Tax=Rheinheimera texasensis TaxID=306205 RepID=UPI000A020902|nr:galactokinase [Rheinheimera texasensis]
MSLSGVLQNMVKTTFQREFGADATQLFSAPGRVNLIGEHTDYNDGFVLPCAIQFETVLASRLVPGSSQIEIFAADYQQLHVIDLTETVQPVATPRWANYVRGVVAGLQQRGLTLPGCQLVVGGNVPQGAGLSSSASLEMVLGLGLSTLAGAPLSPRDNALNGQQAEHQFAGCQCGIMDQLVSAAGLAGQALLLDCRSLDYQTVPMPESLQVLIIHSNVKRGLVDSAYNERREQCEAAARFFGIKALRDVTPEQLEAVRSQLDPLIYARARHVISENNRTEAAAVALKNADIKTLSALMAQSHQSMRDDFAITVPAIDFLVAEVAAICGERGGVRMTGGGFGGCVVALLPADLVEPVCQHLSKVYPAAHRLEPTFYLCQASAGARAL